MFLLSVQMSCLTGTNECGRKEGGINVCEFSTNSQNLLPHFLNHESHSQVTPHFILFSGHSQTSIPQSFLPQIFNSVKGHILNEGFF